ncbi:MAG: NAD(P)-dependent oxidoreductase [Candidatus Staskawiczbacteria bacterium]|nr:NAD(P)-dependent oxidoreductase [Candidatus Staskawiczbacteria bacterium]
MAKKKTKVLITGGAGFIGSNLTRKLVSSGDFEVFIIEKKHANLWRLKDVLDKVTIRYVDIEDSDRLSKFVNSVSPSVIFHLASYGVYPSVQHDLRKMIDINICGTINLVNSLKGCKVSTFVNASSCSEYKSKKTSINEEDPVDPSNVYGVTKLAAELLLKKIAEENNFPVVNLRLFTPFGYFEDGQRLIPYIILNALEGRRIDLASPNYVRDFIFIEDLMDVFIKILEKKHNYKGEIFNIGSGKQHSIKEVVRIIGELLGEKLNVNYGERSSYYKESNFFQADNKKAMGTFDWRINHDFESGILKTINWFRENKKLY